MASYLALDAATEQAMDELVSAGGFRSREEVLRKAVQLVRKREGFDPEIYFEPLAEETVAAIERGIADAEAGRVRPAAEVFADLRRRYAVP